MEWTQTEKANEQAVAEQAPAAPAPQQQGGKKGKSVHISELSIQQLQNIGRKLTFDDKLEVSFRLSFKAYKMSVSETLLSVVYCSILNSISRPNSTRVQHAQAVNEWSQSSWNQLLWSSCRCSELER